MKIYIHYTTTNNPWGGGNSFLKALRKEYIENRMHGVEVASHINEPYDIFLVNGGYSAPGRPVNLREVRSIRKLGYRNFFSFAYKGCKIQQKKIILRLDGARKIYANCEDKTHAIQCACIPFANHIIFQSKYCVETFRDVCSDVGAHDVIYNGVDQKIFFLPPNLRKLTTSIKIVSGSWSSNIMKGHEVIASFSELPDVKVTFVGNWPSEINRKNVTIIPPQRQEMLAQIFLGHHLFLFPSRNDACPNIVLEALSSGLPILYDDSGGTPEVASKYGNVLTGNAAEDLLSITNRYREVQEAIWRDREIFSIVHAAANYSKVFRAAIGSV